jgi:hypothetical protein
MNTPVQHATDEPAANGENVTNEPTDAREIVTNEPTVDGEIATNEPTGACEIVMNEPTLGTDVGLESPTYMKVQNATIESARSAPSEGSQVDWINLAGGQEPRFTRGARGSALAGKGQENARQEPRSREAGSGSEHAWTEPSSPENGSNPPELRIEASTNDGTTVAVHSMGLALAS